MENTLTKVQKKLLIIVLIIHAIFISIFIAIINKNEANAYQIKIAYADDEIYSSGNEDLPKKSLIQDDGYDYITIDNENINDFSEIHLIKDHNYFYLNPAHGDNVEDPAVKLGVCTTVAVDLLMGYHNYFSDRRLIPETDGNGTRFLAENYGDLTYHPYDYFGDPEDPYLNDVNNRLLNSSTALGTDVGFFEKLLDLTPLGNSVIGQILGFAETVIEDFVEQYSPELLDNLFVDWGEYFSVRSNINNDEPAIICCTPFDGADNFHVTVAYGYAKYKGEDGYIVHAGWGANSSRRWIAEKYVSYELVMSLNHRHSKQCTWEYLGDDTSKWIYECSTCGYRERDEIFNLDSSGSVITGIHNQCPDSLTIPDLINGKWITAIGNGAFANNDTIEEINIADAVETIGANAFENCSSLSTVNFVDLGANSSLLTIGNAAFKGCTSLLAFHFPAYTETIGANAFENCTALEGIMQIGNTIEYIGNSAFEGCIKLELVFVPSTLTTIGTNAFNNCIAMTTFAILGDGSQLTTIENAAFANCNSLRGFGFSSVTHVGYDAFSGCASLESVFLRDEMEFIGGNAFKDCAGVTFYAEAPQKPTGWISTWNASSRPVFWGCTFSTESNYVVSFVKSASSPENINAANAIIEPERDGYDFGGWSATPDGSGDVYESVADAPNGTLYTCWTEQACVTEGTMITLADGSQKAVEDLTGDEMLLVWNMFTGEFDSAPILFIDSEPAAEFEVIKLTFSDGTVVEVIDEHAFWNFDLNKYVFIREDAAKYIGDTFNRQTYNENGEMSYSAVQLTDVDIVTEYTTAWSPVTYGHLCYYVNGMLSMPGATEGLINIFEVDPETMTIDPEQYSADIAEYGLYTYDEFVEEVFELPEVMFEAFNGQYMKVAIGKGLITVERLGELFARYGEFFE